MQNLRSRFTPDISDDAGGGEEEDETVTSASTLGLDESEEDYFGYESQGSMNATTPGATLRSQSISRGSISRGSSPLGQRPFQLTQRALFASRVPPQTPQQPVGSKSSFATPSHTQVTAGDLHTSAHGLGENMMETYRPRSRGFTAVQTPGVTRSTHALPTPVRKAARLPHASPFSLSARSLALGSSAGDIDLRDEVMACIAKSIGLIQPPMSATPSATVSPTLAPLSPSTAASASRRDSTYRNSFSTLSLLDTADDAASSVTGASSALGIQPYATGLDNDVEILCFAAGTRLVKAGERNAGKLMLHSVGLLTLLYNHVILIFAGLFYVIDGFLDVSLPADDSGSSPAAAKGGGLTAAVRSNSTATIVGQSRQNSVAQGLNVRWGDATPGPRQQPKTPGVLKPTLSAKTGRHLFTVNPGGIAGYLGKSLGHNLGLMSSGLRSLPTSFFDGNAIIC